MLAFGLLGALTPMGWTAGDLIVPSGRELTISGASCTNTKLSVSGTLNINMASGSTYYSVLTGAIDNPSQSGIKGSTITLGPDPDDDAVVNVLKGYFWGRWSNWMYTSLYFGNSDGSESGKSRLYLAPNTTDNEFNQVYFKAGLQPQHAEDDVIDAIMIDHNAKLVTYTIHQENPKPVRVTFTNSLGNAGASGSTYGRLQIFYASKFLSLSQPGGDLILRGHGKYGNGANAPICIDHWSGTQCYLFSGTQKACLRTEGDCDFVFLVGTSEGFYQDFNATNIIWNHTGDFVIPKSGSANCGIRTSVNNVLPYGPQTGAVRVESWDGAQNGKMGIDLYGTEQRINGLTLMGGSTVLNSQGATKKASLVFGDRDTDGTINAAGALTSTAILCRKVGTGTLTITNTPLLANLTVEAGTVRFSPESLVIPVGPLSIHAGARVVVDGALVVAVAGDVFEGQISCINGGMVTLVRAPQEGEEDIWRYEGSNPDAQFIKEGAGTTTIYNASTTPFDMKALCVARGTLKFATTGSTNAWYKFIFKKMHNNGTFSLSEMLLMDAAGNRIDGGGTYSGLLSPVANAAADVAPQDMTPKSVWASDQNWKLAEPDGGYRQRSPSALFDGMSWTKVDYGGSALSPSSPSTWKTFIVRLPANAGVLSCYNFRNGYSGTSQPSDWEVQTSPNGIDWMTIDEHAGVLPPSGTQKFYNDGVHYAILNGRPGAVGLADGVTVMVERGATLDCTGLATRPEISSLIVDCRAGEGVGTLRNVALAPTGVLTLQSVTGKVMPGVLPLSFVDSVTEGSLSGWTVQTNDVPVRTVSLSWQNGQLALVSPATLVILR